jgi:Glycosyl hydrolase catalytic core
VARGAAVILAVVGALLAANARPASASRFLRVGLFDDTQTLYEPTPRTFEYIKELHAQELRITLNWGGASGVAKYRPHHPSDPNDPAYDWSQYDQAVEDATQAGAHVLFTIYGTPGWANGDRGANTAPTDATDLKDFAYAAAVRYSGLFAGRHDRALPAVRDWLAWNEPNNPVFLTPQFVRRGKRWSMLSPTSYARICNAVYTGVHLTGIAGVRVACGATSPRGNNDPNSIRPSISPIAFIVAAKKAGLETFDAWAHHPYYQSPTDTPTTIPLSPNGAPATAVRLGNIASLIRAVTALYGNKRIWITEYGYQTNPPDPIYGVSDAKQAAYLSEAVQIARENPRIDMFIWFLLEDEPAVAGWQSGLLTSRGAKKPAFNAFMKAAVG